METYIDVQAIGDAARLLRGNFSKTDFYAAVERKHDAEQVLSILERAMKKARSCKSLVKYNFDAEIETISQGIEYYNTRLFKAADFLSELAASVDLNEYELISKLNGEAHPASTASPSTEDDPDFHGVTFFGNQIGFRGGHARGLVSILLGADMEAPGESTSYNSGGSRHSGSFSVLDVGTVFVIGPKDNQTRIPIEANLLKITVETGTPQDDEYASRNQQKGNDGRYNDHGGYAGGRIEFSVIGASAGTGHSDNEGTEDVILNFGFGGGASASINQHEVRDDCGYTGTRYTEMNIMVPTIPVGVTVKSSEKKHAIDYW